ncbi:transposase family protein [Solibacillus sp. MA9]|uniref:Transposase family protein n=1 Tax=Solibacillus palustris TaxID=2908203 RepID=A0ABS9UJ91_9BACL|nr:transposase family protein [Solibacillus sp. MA9]MCH7323995.1 transposase family protein [Solibacillus sp. MA9]
MNYILSELDMELDLEIIHHELTPTEVILFIESMTVTATCPKCLQISHRKHGQSLRKIRDIPISKKDVYLYIRLNKWYCTNPSCPCKYFTESTRIAPAYQRSTLRATHFYKKAEL